MPTYQFTVKPFDQKKWSEAVHRVENCKNAGEAEKVARDMAINYAGAGGEVRYKVYGSHKKHYYRPSEKLKAAIQKKWASGNVNK